MKQYCGLISIIGRPNVGKSTLLNHLIGQKLSITSRKPQTTRHQFIGIKTIANYQFLFIDTPGIHSNSRNIMNQMMNKTAKNATDGVDVILFMVDSLKWTKEEDAIAKYLSNLQIPIIFIPNKIDRVKNLDLLLKFIDKYAINYTETYPISALKGFGVAGLLEILKKYLPISQHRYGTEDIAVNSSKFIAAERIREKLIRRLGEELPYESTVSIDAFEEEKKLIKIAATIWVNRENQKGIVIGKKGLMLKSIGSDTRLELEAIFNQKIFLKLWVKVRKGWADDLQALHSLGYNH